MPKSEVNAKPTHASTHIGPSQHDNVEAALASLSKVAHTIDARAIASSTMVLHQMGDMLACVVMMCGASVVMPGFMFGNISS